jgi:two-component system phosphate regulon sensor histidine kinase PhoR
MSLALVGVILIQVLWIRNAIQLKREQFNRTVNTALLNVSADLENRYGVHFITEKLQSDSSARKEILKQDPGLYQFMISIDQSMPRKNNTDGEIPDETGDGTDVAASSDYSQSAQTIDVKRNDNNEKVVTIVNVNHGQRQEVVIRQPVMAATVANAPAPPAASHAPACKPTADDINAQSCKLMNIVKGAADEWAMSKMDPQAINDVLDSAKIIAAIKREFAKQGLPQDFVFATYCVDGDSLMINKASSNNPLTDYPYKSPLLATDFVDAHSLLLLNFHKQYQYIFSSISSMLVLSLFFTIIIISAFAYSLHVIFKQKKLSEITNDFINNMTHELKTPLATISLTADTLGLEPVTTNPGMVNEYSGMIKNEVKKLSRHVDRILEAAVLERTANSKRTELLNINQLVEDEVKIFEPAIHQKGGSIELSLPADMIKVQGNRDLLRGAICNLLDNALKYSKDVPEIKVSLYQLSGKMQLSVADKGVGISNSDQKMIFEKFYRAHTGNRHDVKGFGLGLSFVKGVVENLGGKIWVESALGKGSNFFVQLPVS